MSSRIARAFRASWPSASAWTLIDVEREVEERLGDTIANLRATYGERHLKTVETEIMDEVVLHRRGLIRVAGSTLGRQRPSSRLATQRRHRLPGRLAGFDLCAASILTLGARYQ